MAHTEARQALPDRFRALVGESINGDTMFHERRWHR